MSRMKRTPGKLEVVESTFEEDVFEIWADVKQIDKGCYMKTSGARICGDFQRRDDADYICRAVNCHDKMLELLKALRDSVIDVKPLLLPDVDDIIAEAEGGGK